MPAGANGIVMPVSIKFDNINTAVEGLRKELSSSLKVNSGSFKDMERQVESISKALVQIKGLTSQPFTSEKQFQAVDKLLTQIQDKVNFMRAKGIPFQDMQPNASELAAYSELEEKIGSLKNRITTLRTEIINSFKVDNGNILRKFIPNYEDLGLDALASKLKTGSNKVQNTIETLQERIAKWETVKSKITSVDTFANATDETRYSAISGIEGFENIFKKNLSFKTSGSKEQLKAALKEQFQLSEADIEEILLGASGKGTGADVAKKLQEKIASLVKNSKNGGTDFYSQLKSSYNPEALEKSKANLEQQIAFANQYKIVLEQLAAARARMSTAGDKETQEIANLQKEKQVLEELIVKRQQSDRQPAFSRLSAEASMLQSQLGSVTADFLKLQRTANTFNSIKMTVTNFMGFYQVLNLIRRGIREAMNTMKELDKAMNGIAIVTNMTTADLWSQVSTYSQMAQKYGVSIAGTYEVSQIYYQQGLQTNEVLTLTNETLKLAKISGMDYKQTTDYMTTALRGFKIEMEDASRVVDVYSALAANTAVTQEELAVAMSKTASSLESVGATFEQSSAMIATMVAVTRESATNIGSALKSIASRYGELTKDPKTLIDADGEAYSFNKVDTALQSVGISLKDTQGQFRNLAEVIEELSKVWDDLDSTQQRYVATQFAGNRQQSRFLALVANYDTYKQNLEVAETADDTGTIQANKALDSLETKLNQVTLAYQQFYTSIGAESVWKGMLDGIKTALNSLNNLPKAFGKVPLAAINMIMDIISLIKKVLSHGIQNLATTLMTHLKNSMAQSGTKEEGEKNAQETVEAMNDKYTAGLKQTVNIFSAAFGKVDEIIEKGKASVKAAMADIKADYTAGRDKTYQNGPTAAQAQSQGQVAQENAVGAAATSAGASVVAAQEQIASATSAATTALQTEVETLEKVATAASGAAAGAEQQAEAEKTASAAMQEKVAASTEKIVAQATPITPINVAEQQQIYQTAMQAAEGFTKEAEAARTVAEAIDKIIIKNSEQSNYFKDIQSLISLAGSISPQQLATNSLNNQVRQIMTNIMNNPQTAAVLGDKAKFNIGRNVEYSQFMAYAQRIKDNSNALAINPIISDGQLQANIGKDIQQGLSLIGPAAAQGTASLDELRIAIGLINESGNIKISLDQSITEKEIPAVVEKLSELSQNTDQITNREIELKVNTEAVDAAAQKMDEFTEKTKQAQAEQEKARAAQIQITQSNLHTNDLRMAYNNSVNAAGGSNADQAKEQLIAQIKQYEAVNSIKYPVEFDYSKLNATQLRAHAEALLKQEGPIDLKANIAADPGLFSYISDQIRSMGLTADMTSNSFSVLGLTTEQSLQLALIGGTNAEEALNKALEQGIITADQKTAAMERLAAANRNVADTSANAARHSLREKASGAANAAGGFINKHGGAYQWGTNLRMLTNFLAARQDTSTRQGQQASGALQGLGGLASIGAGIATGNGMAFVQGITSLWSGISTFHESAQELSERLKKEAEELRTKAQEETANLKKIQAGQKKLDQLEKTRYDSEEAAEEYQNAVDSLVDTFPELIAGYDTLGNAIVDNASMEYVLANARKETAKATYDAALAEAKSAKQAVKTSEDKIASASNTEARAQFRKAATYAEGLQTTYDVIFDAISAIAGAGSETSAYIAQIRPDVEAATNEFSWSAFNNEIGIDLEALFNATEEVNLYDFYQKLIERGQTDAAQAIQDYVKTVYSDTLAYVNEDDWDKTVKENGYSLGTYNQMAAIINDESVLDASQRLLRNNDYLQALDTFAESKDANEVSQAASTIIMIYSEMLSTLDKDSEEFATISELRTQFIKNYYGDIETYERQMRRAKAANSIAAQEYQKYYTKTSGSYVDKDSRLLEIIGEDIAQIVSDSYNGDFEVAAESGTFQAEVARRVEEADKKYKQWEGTLLEDGTTLAEAFDTAWTHRQFWSSGEIIKKFHIDETADSDLFTRVMQEGQELSEDYTTMLLEKIGDSNQEFANQIVKWTQKGANNYSNVQLTSYDFTMLSSLYSEISDLESKGLSHIAQSIQTAGLSFFDELFKTDAETNNTIQQAIKENNAFASKENMQKTLDQLVSGGVITEGDAIYNSLKDYAKAYIDNISLSLQATIDTLFDTLEDKSQNLAKALDGMSVKEAGKVLDTLKNYGIEGFSWADFVQNGSGKLVIKREREDEYVQAMYAWAERERASATAAYNQGNKYLQELQDKTLEDLTTNSEGANRELLDFLVKQGALIYDEAAEGQKYSINTNKYEGAKDLQAVITALGKEWDPLYAQLLGGIDAVLEMMTYQVEWRVGNYTNVIKKYANVDDWIQETGWESTEGDQDAQAAWQAWERDNQSKFIELLQGARTGLTKEQQAAIEYADKGYEQLTADLLAGKKNIQVNQYDGIVSAQIDELQKEINKYQTSGATLIEAVFQVTKAHTSDIDTIIKNQTEALDKMSEEFTGRAGIIGKASFGVTEAANYARAHGYDGSNNQTIQDYLKALGLSYDAYSNTFKANNDFIDKEIKYWTDRTKDTNATTEALATAQQYLRMWQDFKRDRKKNALKTILQNQTNVTAEQLTEFNDAFKEYNIDAYNFVDPDSGKLDFVSLKQALASFGGELAQLLNETTGELTDKAVQFLTNGFTYLTSGTSKASDVEKFISDFNTNYGSDLAFSDFTYDKDLKGWVLSQEAWKTVEEKTKEYLSSLGLIGKDLDDYVNNLKWAALDINSVADYAGKVTHTQQDTSKLKTILTQIYGAGSEEINKVITSLAAGGLDAIQRLKEIAEKTNTEFTEEQYQQAYEKNINEFTSWLELIPQLENGSYVPEQLRQYLKKANYVINNDGIVQTVGDSIEAFKNVYDAMASDAASTTSSLNSAYAQILAYQERGQSAALDALSNAAGMTYDTLGTILADAGILLTSAMNDLEGYGLQTLGAGKVRIKDWAAFTNKTGLNGSGIDSAEYLSAYSAYVDSMIELDKTFKDKVLEEFNSIKEAQVGDKINVSYLIAQFGQDLLESIFGSDAIQDGILTFNQIGKAQYSSMLDLINLMSESGQYNDREIAQMKDDFRTTFITGFAESINKAISGSLTEVEMTALIENSTGLTKDYFIRTENGLKIVTAGAIKLYEQLKLVDSVAANITLKQLIADLQESDEHYQSMASTLRRIEELNKLTQSSEIDDSRREQYEAELKVAEEIARVRATTEDSTYDYMNKAMPSVLNNPMNAIKSVMTAMSNFNNAWQQSTKYFNLNTGKWATGKGMMGVQQFYDFAYMMNDMAKRASGEITMAGMTLDGSAETLNKLVTHAFETMSVLEDGTQVIDLGAIGLDFKTGAAEMQTGVKSGLSTVAKEQIDMLNGMIQLVETMVAMEQLGDLVGEDIIINLPKLIVEGDDKTNWAKANEQFNEWRKQMRDLITNDGEDDKVFNQDLADAAANIKVEGKSLQSIIDGEEGLEKLTAEQAAMITGFYKAAKSGNLSEENIWQSILETMANVEELDGKTVSLQMGKKTVKYAFKDGFQLEVDDKGEYKVGGQTFSSLDDAARAALLQKLGNVKLDGEITDDIISGKLTVGKSEIAVNIDKNKNIHYIGANDTPYNTLDEAIASFFDENGGQALKGTDQYQFELKKWRLQQGYDIAPILGQDSVKLTNEQKNNIEALGENAANELQNKWNEAVQSGKQNDFIATWGFSLEGTTGITDEMLQKLLEDNNVIHQTIDVQFVGEHKDWIAALFNPTNVITKNINFIVGAGKEILDFLMNKNQQPVPSGTPGKKGPNYYATGLEDSDTNKPQQPPKQEGIKIDINASGNLTSGEFNAADTTYTFINADGQSSSTLKAENISATASGNLISSKLNTSGTGHIFIGADGQESSTLNATGVSATASGTVDHSDITILYAGSTNGFELYKGKTKVGSLTADQFQTLAKTGVATLTDKDGNATSVLYYNGDTDSFQLYSLDEGGGPIAAFIAHVASHVDPSVLTKDDVKLVYDGKVDGFKLYKSGSGEGTDSEEVVFTATALAKLLNSGIKVEYTNDGSSLTIPEVGITLPVVTLGTLTGVGTVTGASTTVLFLPGIGVCTIVNKDGATSVVPLGNLTGQGDITQINGTLKLAEGGASFTFDNGDEEGGKKSTIEIPLTPEQQATLSELIYVSSAVGTVNAYIDAKTGGVYVRDANGVAHAITIPEITDPNVTLNASALINYLQGHYGDGTQVEPPTVEETKEKLGLEDGIDIGEILVKYRLKLEQDTYNPHMYNQVPRENLLAAVERAAQGWGESTYKSEFGVSRSNILDYLEEKVDKGYKLNATELKALTGMNVEVGVDKHQSDRAKTIVAKAHELDSLFDQLSELAQLQNIETGSISIFAAALETIANAGTSLSAVAWDTIISGLGKFSAFSVDETAVSELTDLGAALALIVGNEVTDNDVGRTIKSQGMGGLASALVVLSGIAYETINTGLQTLARSLGLLSETMSSPQQPDANKSDKPLELKSGLSQEQLTQMINDPMNKAWEEIDPANFEAVVADMNTILDEQARKDLGFSNQFETATQKFVINAKMFNHMIQLANDALGSTQMPQGLIDIKGMLLELVGIAPGTEKAKHLTELFKGGIEDFANTPIGQINTGFNELQQTIDKLSNANFSGSSSGLTDVKGAVSLLARASFGAVASGLSSIKSALAGWSFPKIPASPSGHTASSNVSQSAEVHTAVDAKGNIGPAQATGTLMGELGPELYVSDGRYHIAGQNGAEFVNLPDDAIVFNHLQTKKLLQTGAAGRGTAITNERKAVAYAKGTGPAMASASAVLATLKQLRSMWQRLADMNLSELAGMGGGGGGGGGGQFTKDLERWFNLLQKIARLEQMITHEQQLQSKLESDRLIHGDQLYLSQQREAQSLQQMVDHNRELLSLQQGRYQERIDELQRNNEFFRMVYTFDENGALQLRNRENSRPGDNFQPITYNGREYADAYAFLAEVASMNPDTGEVKYNPKEQLAMLRQVFGDELVEQYSSYDSSGKKTSNDEERLRAFFDRVDGLKEEVTTLRDSVEETENNLLENQQNLSEILQKFVDNQLAVEQEVIGAIEAREQTAIDEAQKERDAFSKSQEALIDGLSKQLDKERKMYEMQQANEDLNKMRRQLAILQRSGGSQSQIRSLQDQINSASQDAYFNAQQQQIDALKEASDQQIERMDTQIELMTETLEYQKENGLFWPEVTQIMQQSPEEIMNFIQTYKPDYRSDSELQIEENLRQLRNIVEQWTTRRDDPNALDVNGNVTETPDDVYSMYSNWYMNTAYRQFSTTLFSENYAERDQLNQDAINAFYETWNRTGDLRSAQDAAAAVFQSHEDRLNENDRNNHLWQVEDRTNPPGGGTGGNGGNGGTGGTGETQTNTKKSVLRVTIYVNGLLESSEKNEFEGPQLVMPSLFAPPRKNYTVTYAPTQGFTILEGETKGVVVRYTAIADVSSSNQQVSDALTKDESIYTSKTNASPVIAKNSAGISSAQSRLTSLLSLLNSNTAIDTPELNSLLSTWFNNTTPDSLTSLFNSTSALSTLRQLQQSAGQQTTNIVNINNPIVKDEDDIQLIKDTIDEYLGGIAKRSGAYMSVR